MIVWREIRRQPATALWVVMILAALVASGAVELHAPARTGIRPGQPVTAPAIVVQPTSPVQGSQLSAPPEPSPVPLR